MTPLCKIEVTHPRVLREVRGAGDVDEQEGIRPARGAGSAVEATRAPRDAAAAKGADSGVTGHSWLIARD